MRYIVFATDYDGTLATNGHVNDGTVRSLEKLKSSGRKLILVSGRQLDDLKNIFPKHDLCDRIVAENGAILYDPSSQTEKLLGAGPSADFLKQLTIRGVPFDAGKGIVASCVPNERVILDVIRELGLDYQMIFNKGSVMVLPSGVNKATGLRAALDSLHLSLHNTAAIGDAENDHALLAASECGIAVANALPALSEHADIVTTGSEGAGVIEIIDELLEDDLQRYDERITRSSIALGSRRDKTGQEVLVAPNRNNILFAGASASGKSSAVAGILEQLTERGYQFCLLDPEGDYEHFNGAFPIGTHTDAPQAAAVGKALLSPESIIIDFMGVPVPQRPASFASILPAILEIRARTARPQWIVVDEAHHFVPVSSPATNSTIPQKLGGTIFVTVDPQHLDPSALSLFDVILATGDSAPDTLNTLAQSIGINGPQGPLARPGPEEGLVWFLRGKEPPILIRTISAKAGRG